MDADLRERAIALRREGLSKRQIQERLGLTTTWQLNDWLRGEPAPERTKRPRAKDALREQARDMRRAGVMYDEIAEALGVSKSTVSLWVRDLPKPPPRYSPEARRRHLAEIGARACRERAAQAAAQRARAKAEAQRQIGRLSDRELFLVGCALYWAEGAKDKPWRRQERAIFVNSDPNVVAVHLAWLDLLGVERSRLAFRVQIHESADIQGAQRFWADLVGVPVSELKRPTLKSHKATVGRSNVGDGYRGCLRVEVRASADLYRRIEGWWYGIVGGVSGEDSAVQLG